MAAIAQSRASAPGGRCDHRFGAWRRAGGTVRRTRVSWASAQSRSAAVDQENVAARARPRARAAARARGVFRQHRQLAASAASSPGGTKMAAPPLTSRSAATSVATTGVPQAIASTTGRPNPSKCDG